MATVSRIHAVKTPEEIRANLRAVETDLEDYLDEQRRRDAQIMALLNEGNVAKRKPGRPRTRQAGGR